MTEKKLKKMIPLSETAYYILISLIEKNHGYGIMQNVEELTEGRIKLGPGTVYGTLSKMEKDKIIEVVEEINRRKVYLLTNIGRTLLRMEIERVNELSRNGGKVWNQL